MAIAVPLELPHRNVFMSYNFEANYNLPWHANNLIPGILEKFEGWEDGLFQKVEAGRAYQSNKNSSQLENDAEEIETTTSSIDEEVEPEIGSNRTMRSLISRRSFYSVLHEKFRL